MENAEVARVLREVADLLELERANVFRVQAYRNAARTVEALPEPVQSFLDDGAQRLTAMRGVGEDLAGKIAEIARTGSLALVRELKRHAPRGAIDLMHVRGIGPRRARRLCDELGVHSLAALSRAARDGRIRTLSGFGAKSEAAILRELGSRAAEEHRMLRAVAAQYGEELVSWLRATAGVHQVELAGSFRRCRETVGDLDALVSAEDAAAVVDRFVAYPGVATVLEHGGTRAAIRLASGLRVDLRVVAPPSFGAALHYFTGSKAHNIVIRRMGQTRGLKINEYGVFRGTRRIAGRDEREVFRAVGLPWIPPELRENTGEIEAAADGTLPRLVTLEAMRGDLQSHTTDSDGRDSLEAMAEAAEEAGHEYLAITDHSPAVRVARGLDADGFRKQWRRIDALNRRLSRLTLLKGCEVDIHADGSLDLDDRTLAGFDLVVASVHSGFSLAREAQTERLLRAISHPSVDVIAHPTGRQIGRRAAIDVDLERVLRAAADAGVWMEINAQPERLDLDDVACRLAVAAGVTLVIDTDAHSTAELRFLRWGVDQARRGWVESDRVANTKPLAVLRQSLRRAHVTHRGFGQRSA